MVVIALLVHKAPESIGLGSYLTSRSLSRKQILTYLLVSRFCASNIIDLQLSCTGNCFYQLLPLK